MNTTRKYLTMFGQAQLMQETAAAALAKQVPTSAKGKLAWLMQEVGPFVAEKYGCTLEQSETGRPKYLHDDARVASAAAQFQQRLIRALARYDVTFPGARNRQAGDEIELLAGRLLKKYSKRELGRLIRLLQA